ncbi:hypothetical protein A3F57_06300 [Candidatus Roizmanbacteria bacterium RIFCSPHIGHO2_12_FULL_36_11]|nr:MAG: hypothetical protein A3F57_06300 [Candidatus Roizmanbacteria bacterium RIFCSPHIGHO2_12_FULL_36_11]
MNSSNLLNKVIVITGGGSGLGRSIAIKVADLGAKVALIARTEKELREVKDLIITKKGTAEYYICDTRNLDQVKNTIKKYF